MGTHICGDPNSPCDADCMGRYIREDEIAYLRRQLADGCKLLEECKLEIVRLLTKKNLLTSQLAEVTAERDRLLKAHKEIAKQKLESEIPKQDRDDGDYRGAYDCIVRVARAALRRENDNEIQEETSCY